MCRVVRPPPRRDQLDANEKTVNGDQQVILGKVAAVFRLPNRRLNRQPRKVKAQAELRLSRDLRRLRVRALHIRRLLSRARVCIFCGQPPAAKNREHIVPRWLIQLTGDPNRKIILGPFISHAILGSRAGPFKTLSFDSFSVPSCETCNRKFSELEGRAKPLISSLLAAEPLTASDFDTILDWFDKVRVGLWLAFHYFLDRNYWGVVPHFFVSDRIAAADRFLLIYRARTYDPGIRFAGVNTPSFAHTPSCFTLVINEWFLVNMSYQMLLSQAAGLPFQAAYLFGPDERLHAELQPGQERLSHPLLPFPQPLDAVSIGQPILPNIQAIPELADLYQSDYVSSMTLREARGVVLLDKGGRVTAYPNAPTAAWCSPPLGDFRDLLLRNAKETLELQNQLTGMITLSPSLAPKQKRYMERQNANCIHANEMLLELVAKRHAKGQL